MSASLIFALFGVAWDLRRNGRVHPAWGFGLGAMAGCLVLTEAITYGPICADPIQGANLFELATDRGDRRPAGSSVSRSRPCRRP